MGSGALALLGLIGALHEESRLELRTAGAQYRAWLSGSNPGAGADGGVESGRDVFAAIYGERLAGPL